MSIEFTKEDEKHLIVEELENQLQQKENIIKELQDTKEHLGEYLYEQEEENKRLNNIINKAIEYIKLVATDHDIMNNNEIIYTQMQYEEIENLLDILQGSDKE